MFNMVPKYENSGRYTWFCFRTIMFNMVPKATVSNLIKK